MKFEENGTLKNGGYPDDRKQHEIQKGGRLEQFGGNQTTGKDRKLGKTKREIENKEGIRTSRKNKKKLYKYMYKPHKIR